MISYATKPYEPQEIKHILHPLVTQWFFGRFKEFSIPQLFGVMEIHSRKNILLCAPTGATKTLTAFLSIINELVDSAHKGILEDRVYCIYLSPLKALNYDIEHNLVTPLKEIEGIFGHELNIRVAVRTGDTTPSQRQGMLQKPPHILITTPESLAIMLSSIKFSTLLQKVEWCIVDEIHALADNKRGVHLSLSLERLERISPAMARVGLSATVSPLESVAKFLVGYASKAERDCTVIDVQFLKKTDMKVLCPVQNLIETEHEELHKALYTQLHDLIQSHRTTLIFTNTRSATERVVHYLKEKYPTEYFDNIGAHHGSLSKALRHALEQRLRNGELKVIVSSTSLELGLDIGFIDLVVCLGSPKSVARFLQRAGRSGHRLHDTVKARIIVLDRDDLVECSVLLKSALEKKIDTLHIPKNCLDVLAQHVHGMALEKTWTVSEMFGLIRQSYCYHELSSGDFIELLDYLAGKFASLEDRHIYAKIWYDSETQMIGKKGKLSRVIYMTNIGTIPDETHVLIKEGTQVIGTIDEGFLERLHRGDVFALGGEKFEFLHAKGMVAYVSSSAHKSPTIPSWFSEMLPLSFELALEIGRLRKLINERFCLNKSKKEILEFINSYLYLDGWGAESLYEYFYEQFSYAQIPSHTRIIVEHYTDQRKRRYAIFHTLYGRRVNDCISRAVGYAIAKTQHRDVEIGINDNGFYIASDRTVSAVRALGLLKSSELPTIMKSAIEHTEILKRRFRHCAARAFMILRTYKGHQKKVGRQQVSSMILMSAVKRINQNFCILKEARREVLQDVMDIENARNVLAGIEEKKILVHEITTQLPSPFAFNLITQGFVDVMRIEDKMEFIRRLHQMVKAKIALKK